MRDTIYYETVSDALNGLKKRGYDFDFELQSEKDCLYCKNNSLQLSPDEFEIDEIHRFEGNTDPGDEMIIYAISSGKYNLKGVVVDAYGPYSDGHSSAIVAKLRQKRP